MKHFNYLLPVLVFFGITACSQPPQIGERKQELPSLNGTKIVIERMYATSVALEANSGIENLFDNDPSTKWKLVKGAGAGEGLMLYFESPTMIESMQIDEAQVNGENQVDDVQVFVDGENLGEFAPGESMHIGKTASSMFIKIEALEDEENFDYFINRGMGSLVKPKKSPQIAFSELKIWGEKHTPLEIQALKMAKGTVEASSSLLPETAYHPAFLFDSRNGFGWAEGDKGSGEGQTLKFSFAQNVKIEKIKIWNGYQRSDAHFDSNARLKSFQFGAQGKASGNYTLADQQAASTITLDAPLQGQNFELTISSVYPGAKYTDLVLSELRFFDGQNWFGIATDVQAKTVALFQEKVKNTPLASVLDKNLREHWYYSLPDGQVGSRFEGRELLLRSDGTFVMYLNSSENTDKQKNEIAQVADGNWEIESAAPEVSKIKIFGKLNRIQDKEKYYVGKTKNDKTMIFKEFLIVQNGAVYGEKLLDSVRIDIRPSDFVACGEFAKMSVDLRYKTDDNFMKMMLYSDCQECILRQETAKALEKANSLLVQEKGKDFQLLIWDAYRPYSVQKLMWEKIKDARYVADPYNGGSSHNRGVAVDISICKKGTLESIPMGTAHDHFGDEAHWSYKNLSAEELANRALLKKVMEGAGFKALESEWWHWSLKGVTEPIADIDAENCAP